MNPLVPDFILTQETRGRTEGNFAAAALFIDIPGFTQLTAKLFQRRLEQYNNFRKEQAEHEILEQERAEEVLANALRIYFDPLFQAVHEQGGFIIGFAGDAFTARKPTQDASFFYARRIFGNGNESCPNGTLLGFGGLRADKPTRTKRSRIVSCVDAV